MSGRLSLSAEIVGRADQTLTEVVMPEPVHNHTRKQCARSLLGIRHPFREGGSAEGRIGARMRDLSEVILGRLVLEESREEAKLHGLDFLVNIAACQQERGQGRRTRVD